MWPFKKKVKDSDLPYDYPKIDFEPYIKELYVTCSDCLCVLDKKLAQPVKVNGFYNHPNRSTNKYEKINYYCGGCTKPYNLMVVHNSSVKDGVRYYKHFRKEFVLLVNENGSLTDKAVLELNLFLDQIKEVIDKNDNSTGKV